MYNKKMLLLTAAVIIIVVSAGSYYKNHLHNQKDVSQMKIIH
jgi:hypothetical protein